MWLLEEAADVFVLTECKWSRGCQLLADFFSVYGYHVVFPQPEDREYGVLIASKYELSLSRFATHIGYLSARVVSATISSFGGRLEVIGVYVPSRGFDSKGPRAQKKRRFIESVYRALALTDSVGRVFCGDLNVLEPGHDPHYRHLEEWETDFYRNIPNYHLTDAFRFLHPGAREYSWVGRSGDGYRYDHCFVSDDLLTTVRRCSYIHQTRTAGLSDHSAMLLELRGSVR